MSIETYSSPPCWREATRQQRAGIVVSWVGAWVIGMVLTIGGLVALSQTLTGWSRLMSEHHACLQHATNGAEIERCH